MRLEQLAVQLGCELRGDPLVEVRRVATLAHAGEGDLSFLANSAYRHLLPDTGASAVVLAPDDAGKCPVAALVSPDPYLAYARAAALLHPPAAASPGIHPTAVVAEDARVDASAEIGPQAVIASGAEIGPGAVVGAGSHVGAGSRIGEGSRLAPRVTVCDGVSIGARALVHGGAVIGADGFGIANDGGRWVKVPQVGGVVIGDDVEIGANTTIDRGAIGDTVIEDGVKLDNQIQIAHNVVVGAHTAIAAMVGISGSTRIGRHCMIGGQAGFVGHLEIADGVVVTARTMVTGSITEPGVYSGGLPGDEAQRFRRNAVRFRQLEELARRLRVLERNQDAGRHEQRNENGADEQ